MRRYHEVIGNRSTRADIVSSESKTAAVVVDALKRASPGFVIFYARRMEASCVSFVFPIYVPLGGLYTNKIHYRMSNAIDQMGLLPHGCFHGKTTTDEAKGAR